MKMEIQRIISQDELISHLHQTRSLNNPNDLPYAGADISLEKHDINAVSPTQLYAISEGIDTQREIRNLLLRHQGEDILDMQSGGVEVIINDRTEVIMPPIAEQSVQFDKPLLLDGTHRTILARLLGETTVRYIYVQNIGEEFDIAHRRLPNEWDDIRLFPTEEHYLAARANGFVHRRSGVGGDKSYRDFSHLIGRGKCTRV